MEEDVEPAGPETDLGLTKLELPLGQEEFVEIDGEDDAQENMLTETKVEGNHYCVVDC